MRRVQPARCNVSQYIHLCKTLCMFQTGFPSIKSSKLHIQRQVFVRTILLPAARLTVPARLAAGSKRQQKSWWTTELLQACWAGGTTNFIGLNYSQIINYLCYCTYRIADMKQITQRRWIYLEYISSKT